MDKYVTGSVIRRLRENKNMTQEELAGKVFVSSKAVSKWETGQGFPDISLIEPLAKALDISVIELLFCGNVINTTGEAVISCCGITLPPLEAESCDGEHDITVETIEDEYYVTVSHPMTKEHYISFLAAVSDQGVQFIKLYPEGNAEAVFRINCVSRIYAYCNRHGLFMLKM